MTKYNVTAHSHQPILVVNHPKLETPYSRVVEYRHLPGQQTSSHTVYFQILDQGEPYYPVRNKRNNDLFSKYKEMAEKEKDVVFVGRLASYEYLDMDATVLRALEVFDSARNQFKGLASYEYNEATVSHQSLRSKGKRFCSGEFESKASCKINN